MLRSQHGLAALAAASLMIVASAACAQWQFEGKFGCSRRAVGSDHVVRVSCNIEHKRGNRIYESTLTFNVRGSIARYYIGKHDECWLVKAEETQQNQELLACTGIPKWW
jgi:hypothetical protein